MVAPRTDLIVESSLDIDFLFVFGWPDLNLMTTLKKWLDQKDQDWIKYFNFDWIRSPVIHWKIKEEKVDEN